MNDTLDLITNDDRKEVAVQAPTIINILEAAVKGGITSDNVVVAKELIQLIREQRAEEAKAAFAKALFQLRKHMPEIYIDKEAKDRSGNVAYRYCSEEEISKKLEPHLMAYGFTTLFGQREGEGRVTVELTLMHEAGHQEVREFTVRAGATNAMKDATAADAGAATTAWRHLMMKMFGLKSRFSAMDANDARIEGEFISFEQAETLRELVKETQSDEIAFLRFAGATKYEEIGSARYQQLFGILNKKVRK